MSKELSLKGVLPALVAAGQKLRPYVGFSVFLLLAIIYAFMIMRINAYSNPTVGEDEVLAGTKTSPAPKIDDNAAAKLRSLQDNSVNVQTLFEEGRENPFGE